MSEFCKKPLSSLLQERYISGSTQEFEKAGNFIGSERIFPLYSKINELCELLFKATYADPRPLSGMNATTTVLLSLLNVGDEILHLSPSAGGHESFPVILKRLGFISTEVPYDFNNLKPDYSALNELLISGRYKAVLFAPSDIISFPELNEIEIPEETILIYDATQTLGHIAAGIAPNPLEQQQNCVLVGGTHKSLPGPTSGLILCRNERLSQILDSTVSPIYIRNPQPHQIASLLLTLIEFSEFGYDYMSATTNNANLLASHLCNHGVEVLSPSSNLSRRWTNTHQLILHCAKDELSVVERNASKHGVTLNIKTKKIYKGSGIRLGLQEITRFGWCDNSVQLVSEIICLLFKRDLDPVLISGLLGELPRNRKFNYTFDSDMGI